MERRMHDMAEMMKKLHRMGRYGGYGGLKTMVLYTLSEQPKNGVEIMDAIEMMSFGHWKPSPGSIYPLLKKAMTEENLVRKRDDGRYELTPEGGAEIEGSGVGRGPASTSVDGAIAEIDNYLSYLEDLPRERVARHRERIEGIAERLERLREVVAHADE